MRGLARRLCLGAALTAGVQAATATEFETEPQQPAGDQASPPANPEATSDTASTPGEAQPQQPAAQQDNKRLVFVLPNFRGASASDPFVPITAKEKLTMARKDTLNYPVFVVTGLFAGIYHLQNQNPSYGQGLAGYGRRYGSALADQIMSNFLTEGVYPALLRQDPRYFRLGPEGGSKWRRARYALTRVFVTRNDSGKWTVNYSELGGVATATAVSNAYYPEEARTAAQNLEKFSLQLGGDALYHVLREFWPDVQQKLTGK